MKRVEMIKTKLTVLFIAGHLFFACNVVTVEQPIGEPIMSDISSEFDGVWQGGEDNSIFYVKSRSNGVLQMAGVEWRNEQFVLQDTTCVLTTLDDISYINFPVADTTQKKSLYVFTHYARSDDDYMVVYSLNTDFFKKAVKNGELKGQVISRHGDYIYIQDTKENVDNFIRGHSAREMIEFKDVLVLKRISSDIPEKVFE